MKVELSDIGDACVEIREYASEIWLRTVRMETHILPLDEHDMRYQLGLIVTAVVKGTDGDWLIEFGDSAGEIYTNDIHEIQQKVRDTLSSWEKRIQLVCRECDLKLRSGKWEAF